jgi:DNA-binding NtrC family response regulator
LAQGLTAMGTLNHGDWEEERMIQSDPRNSAHVRFPSRAPQESLTLNSPSGLVVCSDDETRRTLAEILRGCELAPILAATAAEISMALACSEVYLVLCEESGVDANYRGVVEIVKRVERKIPVIVVSRTGDWSDYLTALHNGAFDRLAYPPSPGEFQRVIRNAFREQRAARRPLCEGPNSLCTGRMGEMA